MNLALKDIRFSPARFVLSALGVAFLLTAVIGMVGLYRGIVKDALVIVDGIGADLWIVQGERAAPFAESSAIPSSADRRVEGIAGVVSVRRFVQFSQQFTFQGRSRRATITGVEYPKDAGSWIAIVAGRYLASDHYEAVADVSTGLALGDVVRLGLDDYQIVGISNQMVDSSGDGLLFVSINDAVSIAERRTSEAVLLARASNSISGPPASVSNSSVAQESKISAVVVTLDPATDASKVEKAVLAWGDLSVLSHTDQRNLILNARLWKLRVQILAFTILILLITCIVVSLIVYTVTIEKLHEIAMLKLIGAHNSFIVIMIGQHAALIGITGYVVALFVSYLVFPFFPRRIVVDPMDMLGLLILLALICCVGSCAGIARALNVSARKVLS